MKIFKLALIFSLFTLLSVNSQNGESSLDVKIDSILNLLTLEEKVAMCHAQSKFSSPGVDRLGIPKFGCQIVHREFVEKLIGITGNLQNGQMIRLRHFLP